MTKNKTRKRLEIKRHAIKKDLLYFATPALVIFFLELQFCSRDGLNGFWGTMWGLIKRPHGLFSLPTLSICGIALILIGFIFLLVGQITLGLNHSSSLVIRQDHKLITHGIYKITRNPMYLGGLLVVIGLPVYTLSLKGFFTSLLLIPIVLIRIKLEEELLAEEFEVEFYKYKESTKRLIPFLY